jgi:hypothetical protein
LPPLLAETDLGTVLDVGCGEQPFRALIEDSGRRYVSMDVAQNSTRSVDVVSTLEHAETPPTPHSVVLCTEVLEHVVNIDAAFAGLRRLVVTDGTVALTVPFVFPMHMEPFDFRRLTLRGIEQLAADHGFRVESSTRLGGITDVLSTLVADVSVLPTSRSLTARIKVRLIRLALIIFIKALKVDWVRHHVELNSNSYLSNGVVLRSW